MKCWCLLFSINHKGSWHINPCTPSALYPANQPKEVRTLHSPQVNSIDQLLVPVFRFQSGPLVALFTRTLKCKPVLISANTELMDSLYTSLELSGASRYPVHCLDKCHTNEQVISTEWALPGRILGALWRIACVVWSQKCNKPFFGHC